MSEKLGDALDQWIAQMPDIYREVLRAFPAWRPLRRLHEALTLDQIFRACHPRWTRQEIDLAAIELRRAGLMMQRNAFVAFFAPEDSLRPTDLGEYAILRLTRRSLPAVPPLPDPPRPLPPLNLASACGPTATQESSVRTTTTYQPAPPPPPPKR